MRQSSLFRIIFLALLMMHIVLIQAQTLQVELSPDKSKVDRSVNNGTATIFFDSNVEDLSIVCTDQNPDELIQKIGTKFWVMHINPKKDIELDSVCYRSFLLNSPLSAEYQLTTPDIGYNQVLYYTVILPNQFPTSLSVEYLFTKSGKHGIRISFGKRIGGYFSYKWGKYEPSGNNVDNITTDGDLSHAKLLGKIRTSITGGLRLGILKSTKYKFGLYMLAGGGYGEYGRQWVNPTRLENNIYFYSDYIKGFDGEIALQCVLKNWLTLSVGGDVILGNGRVSVDYQLGVGIDLNLDKLLIKR
ncbi:hypothetical protein SAMN04487901_11011 [Prevotella communis]|uniref:Uncharacterized protein n=1 Tax=Prevotella communis TaxID=2913614 RepID=A0A1G7X8V9_9BACT|nr:hypothetical protein [Prevotella communis]SDG80584.1 hypothetical protein SAMN04487901_11011 [Prevotella communis]